MCSIEIREALPGDADSILAYAKRIGGESDNLTYGAEGLPVTAEQEKALLRRMRDDRCSVFYCAWKGDELVGTGSLSGLPRRMKHRAELGLSVVKAEWNKGIGGMLMERLIGHAGKNGIKIIQIEVRSDNLWSLHLAEKYGFKHIGTFPAFFQIGGEYIDFEILYLDLR